MTNKNLNMMGTVLILLAMVVLGAAIARLSWTALLFYLAVILLWCGIGCVEAGKEGDKTNAK